METLSSADNFQRIPGDFDHSKFISSLTKTDTVTEVSKSFQASVNGLFHSLVQYDVLPMTNLFLGVQWSRISSLLIEQVSENVEKKVQRKDFTCHVSDLHSLLLSKELEYGFAGLMVIPVATLAKHHFHVMTEIVLALNARILKVIVGERLPSNIESNVRMDVR